MEESKLITRLKEICQSEIKEKLGLAWKELKDEDLNKIHFSDAKIKIVKREGLASDNYKIIEITQWESEVQKECVLLGFNPTNTDIEEIDNTNKKIIKLLKNEYNKVILLNYHIQKTKDKEDFSDDDKDIELYQPILPELLNTVLDNNTDLLVFWGRTVSFSEELKLILFKFLDKGKLLITVKKGEDKHYHPARIKADFRKAKKDDFLSTNSIQ